MIEHNIPPVFDSFSSILILGSFPSVRSRESGFFYGHPQNRFWRVMGSVYNEAPPQTNAEKRAFLLAHRIALWDVAASCEITGSADSGIYSVIPNDISVVLNTAVVEKVYVNGRTAQKLYDKLILPQTGVQAIYLPSTSPANAKMSLSELITSWSIIKA